VPKGLTMEAKLVGTTKRSKVNSGRVGERRGKNNKEGKKKRESTWHILQGLSFKGLPASGKRANVRGKRVRRRQWAWTRTKRGQPFCDLSTKRDLNF